MSRSASRRRFNPSGSKEPLVLSSFFFLCEFSVKFSRFTDCRFSVTSMDVGNSSARLALVNADLVLTKISVMIESASSPKPATRIHQSHAERNPAEDSAGALGGGGSSTFVVDNSTLRPDCDGFTLFRFDQYAVSLRRRSVAFSISAIRSAAAVILALSAEIG